MKRLTPKEFFEQNFTTPTFEKPGGESFGRLQSEIERLMQAYAEHLEETAWQEIDEMPLVDENGVHSIKILIETPFNGVVEGLVDMENDIWFSATGYKVTPLRWRASPTPPEK